MYVQENLTFWHIYNRFYSQLFSAFRHKKTTLLLKGEWLVVRFFFCSDRIQDFIQLGGVPAFNP